MTEKEVEMKCIKQNQQPNSGILVWRKKIFSPSWMMGVVPEFSSPECYTPLSKSV
jgi:hypothetical protein